MSHSAKPTTLWPRSSTARAPEPLMRIFISYSSKDHDYAEAVYDLLQTIGQDVFWAAETLRPGEQFESLLA